ncbi:MAG: WHG domain-containing protein [Solirubrobacterales bacterium]|nr:WHG domain-containing protein [Solirubrobacterales bacterium]
MPPSSADPGPTPGATSADPGRTSDAGSAGPGRGALLAAARAELADHGHADISLRAVARRAGVSHAAPKYHFRDRAGLLSAVAAEGFDGLTERLRRAVATATEMPMTALGKAYIDYGLEHRALFDLMFRPSELRTDDSELARAQAGAFGVLAETVAASAEPAASPEAVSELALTSWGLVHGLVTLARDGALANASGTTDPAAAAELTHHLADAFTRRVFAPAMTHHPEPTQT